MWPFQVSKQRYEAVPGGDEESKNDHHPQHTNLGHRWHQQAIWRTALVIASVVALSVVAMGVVVVYRASSTARASSQESLGDEASTVHPTTGSSSCARRREWRTLSSNEQQTYISAVLCLRLRPSILAPASNKTAYDDFPWIHSHVGYYTHNSAPFLPWHRYFLHIYESTLRDQCGYEGALVYWDWTLDSAALEQSPVFDPDTGFGGDGEVGGVTTVGRSGRCIVDGPFAGVTADYYDVKYDPHCLSRGFRDLNGDLGHIDGRDITPDSIEEVLSLVDYESFVALMESRVHDAIPFGIGGDFETFTAPYDPLFFLHHTQLDRLWWLWQQRQPNRGLQAYSGHKHRHSPEMASMEDVISMQGLASSIKVASIMNVEEPLLCYEY